MQLPAGDALRDSSPIRREQTGIQLPRIVIVGTGLVGATTAYALLLSGMAVEIIVVGRDPRRT
jgi:threonine dehydrogenase-like Zn-dependent dehydrogenase